VCQFCHELAPKLEQVYRGIPDLRVLIVSRGGAEANRTEIIEHGLTIPVVLQRHWEISRTYGMLATPIAYLIDEGGTIAAPVAVGIDEILTLTTAAKAAGNRTRAEVAI